MKYLSALDFLCEQTGTCGSDWVNMDGPESGVGVDHWFYNEATQQEAYVNEDQGHFTYEVSE